MLNFILALCVIFASLALIAIAFELKNTRSVIEDLAAGIDELNSNLRVQNAKIDELNSNARESGMSKGRN